MTRELKGNLMLILTAMIWGAAFVAQSVSMDLIGPFTFQSVRSALGCIVLIPLILLRRNKPFEDRPQKTGKIQWIAGLAVGVVFFIASNLQQFGLCYTSAGKAGFITAMYIIFVPLVGLFFHKKAGWNIWLSVLLALFGLYLLCMTSGFSVNFGDFLVFLCALAFTVHILVIDYFGPKVDSVLLSCSQFAVNAVLSGIAMFLFEEPSVDAIVDCWLPIGYAGVFSSGVAYTLQIVGQKYTKPTVASLLMSLESVFAVIFSWILIQEALSGREIIGCVIMFAAIVLAQLPARKKAETL